MQDILVIGSGAAGLSFALELSRTRKVLILSKDKIAESNTRYAQGGIAAVLRYDDDYAAHIEDTMNAGAMMNDQMAVRVMVLEAPARIRSLARMGVDFDKAHDKSLLFTREGGHRSSRVLHVGDMTGQAIEDCLVERVRENENIEIRTGCTAIDMAVENGHCGGAYVFSEDGAVSLIRAKAVLLATGGGGQCYSRNTNPLVATGDGFAMAQRAGAALKNMAFVQFHPTAFHRPPDPPFLISEAVRGEGGLLLNDLKERFLPNYHPSAELAPRDIVSRAIVSEMAARKIDHVWLDLSHLRRSYLENRFPTIHQKCAEFGINIANEPIPVSPAAHYFCGGVNVDIDGRTDIEGLYACGEVACTGVHGANRLASNSLLESIVFAYRAAVHADQYIRYMPNPTLELLEKMPNRAPVPGKEMEDPAVLTDIWERMRGITWTNVGIVRSSEGLREAVEELSGIQRKVEQIWRSRKPNKHLISLRNMSLTAERVARDASELDKNIGTHYNVDIL